MKRLTCKTLKVACDSFISLDSKEERTKFRLLAEAAPKYEELYKRLAEYEDLEEKIRSEMNRIAEENYVEVDKYNALNWVLEQIND